MFLQCVFTIIIVYIIISPLNLYLYIHWILEINIIIINNNVIYKYYITQHNSCNLGAYKTMSYIDLLYYIMIYHNMYHNL